MKLKTILVIVIAIITTSLSAQIIEDNRERTIVTSVKGTFDSFAALRTLEDDYYITYRDTKYSSITSMESFNIGDIDSYNAFRKIVLEAFGDEKKGNVKRFSLNDKKFIIRTFTKKMVRIEIYDSGIMSDFGFWKINKINKLLPKLD